MVHVDETSSLCFLFGINAAPKINYSQMVKHGLVNYMDDFLIHSPTLETYNKILTTILESAKVVGLKFNNHSSSVLKT